jgi:hypothetical protein
MNSSLPNWIVWMVVKLYTPDNSEDSSQFHYKLSIGNVQANTESSRALQKVLVGHKIEINRYTVK